MIYYFAGVFTPYVSRETFVRKTSPPKFPLGDFLASFPVGDLLPGGWDFGKSTLIIPKNYLPLLLAFGDIDYALVC